MYDIIRPVAPVLLGVVFMEAALGALSPLIGLQLVRRAVPTELIGIVTSAYFVGFLLGTLTAARVIDRVGHIRAFSVFAAIAANATLLHVVFGHPIAWIGFRGVTGYALAGLFVIAESWLNDKASVETRGRIFAAYTAISWAASGIGPLALNLDDPQGTLLFSLITIVLATALIPMALTKVGNPEIHQRSHLSIRRLYGISPLGVFACFGSGLVNTALYGLLPVYTEAAGYTASQLSIVLSVSVISALAIQFPIGWASDHFGRRPVMLAICLAAASFCVGILLVGGESFPALLGLTFLLTSMTSTLYALGVGQTSDYISKRDFVAASSGLLFAWGVGASIGPTAAAAFMSPLGARGLFVFLAAALGAIACFILIRMAIRRALSAREQGNFVAVPQTQGTYGAPELDPRGEPEPDRVGDALSVK